MPTAARGLTVERLAWDSAHFGLPVGRVVAREDDADALAEALARAAADGFELVYAFTPPELAIPDELLRRFDGLKVDDRVVFSAEPRRADDEHPSPLEGEEGESSPLPPGEGGRAAAGEGRRSAEGLSARESAEPGPSQSTRRPSPGPSGHPLPTGEGTVGSTWPLPHASRVEHPYPSGHLREVDQADGPGDLIVVDRPAGPASPALVELALAAGAFSRFAVDPRIPHEAFWGLYAIWVERSCRRESADAVFVAEDRDVPGVPLGLATVAVKGEAATIGLVAVSERARRRGVGRAMMARCRDWLRGRGVGRVDVATQLANGPACGLYRACGYRPSSFETIHHFRPRG